MFSMSTCLHLSLKIMNIPCSHHLCLQPIATVNIFHEIIIKSGTAILKGEHKLSHRGKYTFFAVFTFPVVSGNIYKSLTKSNWGPQKTFQKHVGHSIYTNEDRPKDGKKKRKGSYMLFHKSPWAKTHWVVQVTFPLAVHYHYAATWRLSVDVADLSYVPIVTYHPPVFNEEKEQATSLENRFFVLTTVKLSRKYCMAFCFSLHQCSHCFHITKALEVLLLYHNYVIILLIEWLQYI